MTFPFSRKFRLLAFRLRYRIEPDAFPAFLPIMTDEFHETVIGIGGYKECHCAGISVKKRLLKTLGEIGGFPVRVDSRKSPVNLLHLSGACAGFDPHRFPVENISAVAPAGNPDTLI